jgi:hypothetical protein
MPLKPGDSRAELAYFQMKKPGGGTGPQVYVHFNPESLQYTVQNTIKEEGRGSKKKQHVSQTSGKLTMQLVFDTTDTGEDVRVYTDEVAKFLNPDTAGNDKTAPLVEFYWGAYHFAGLVEQYKETIDFFAAAGVPLRSNVDITLASQDPKQIFNSSHNPNATVDQQLSTQEPTVHQQPDQTNQSSGPAGAAGLANALGNPRVARAIASLNGSASLRFGAGGSLAVAGSVGLQAPAAFSAGASGGFGLSAGAGLSLSAGLSAGASLSATGGGAFAGLRATTDSSLSLPSGRALFSGGADVGTGAGAQFAAGGRAQASGGASLSAEVGADADLNARINFG